MSELMKVIDRRAITPGDVQYVPAAVTPMDLLRIATSQGADLDKLEKLMDLQQRWQRDEARRAFTEAMAAFHVDPPQLTKNKHVNFKTKTGATMDYRHATHDEVTGKIGAALAKHGLSHAWRMRQEGGIVYVTCTLTHAQGHSESFELFGSPDDSGLKSPLQAVASTITFLQRYTLLGATGLSTSELGAADDDAKGGSPREPEPEGYADFCANIESLADNRRVEGLNEAWANASPAIRRYVTRYDGVWWTDERARAAGKLEGPR